MKTYYSSPGGFFSTREEAIRSLEQIEEKLDRIEEEISSTDQVMFWANNALENCKRKYRLASNVGSPRTPVPERRELTLAHKVVGGVLLFWATTVTGYLCSGDKNFTQGIFWKYIFPSVVGLLMSQLMVLAMSRRTKVLEANEARERAEGKLKEIEKLTKECYTQDYRSSGRKCPVLRQIAGIAKE